jgi:endonuclease-8
MPEGPEIRCAADLVEAALKERKAEDVWFGLPGLKKFETHLTGQTVTGVDTHGKAMLTRFDNDLTIYSHNQLYGRWYTGKPDLLPDTNRQLRLAIRNRDNAALLYSASEIGVLTETELEHHPFLSRLGPDVLHRTTTVDAILSRLVSDKYRKRRLGGFLTDQSFVAGLGNYLRCELLFLAGLHPASRPIDCSEEQLETLAGLILDLPRQSYRTSGITNDPKAAEKLMADGTRFEEARFYIFRRDGLPCRKCGSKIVRLNAGGQSCYLCESCQPAKEQ